MMIFCTALRVLSSLSIALLVFTVSVSAWTKGAPASSCGTMLISHSGSPQAPGNGGYSLIVPSNYTAGQLVTIEVTGTTVFRGMQVQAFNSAGQPVGHFPWALLPPNHFAFCSGNSSISQGARLAVSRMQYQWMSPANPGTGPIHFKFGIVVLKLNWYILSSPVMMEVGVGPSKPASFPSYPTGVLLSGLSPTTFNVMFTQASAPCSSPDDLISLNVVELMRAGNATISYPWVAVASQSASSCAAAGSSCTINLPVGSTVAGTNYSVCIRAQTIAGATSRCSALIIVRTPTNSAAGAVFYPGPKLSSPSSPSAVMPESPMTFDGNSTSVKLSWLGVFDLLGYTLSSYDVQVFVNNQWQSVYSGFDTSFSYSVMQDLTNLTVSNFAARVRSTTIVATPSAWQLLNITSTPPSSCLSGCSNHGDCVQSACRCQSGFLGPDCSITGGFNLLLSPATTPIDLTMESKVVDDMIYFRLQARTNYWIGLDFNVGADGMTAVDGGEGDVIAVSKENGAWTVVDAHVNGLNPVYADSANDLLHAVAWYDGTTGLLTGTWSRKLDTKDNVNDQIIINGAMPMSWGVGNGPSVYTSSHGAQAEDRGKFSFNFMTGAMQQPSPLRPWVIIGWSFLVPSFIFLVVTAMIHTVPCIANTGIARWLEFGRPEHLIEFSSPFVRTIDSWTLGSIHLVQSMNYGERIFLAMYLLQHVAFLVLSASIYKQAARMFIFCFGYLCSASFAIVLLPVSRNSIFLFLFGISFERAVKWHRIFAFGCMLAIIVHTITMAMTYSADQIMSTVPTREGYGNIYGTLAGIFLAPVFLLAYEPIRRQFFEVFYYSHQLFFVGIILSFLHSTSAFYMGVLPFCLHLIDRGVRWWRGHKSTTIQGVRFLSAGPNKKKVVVELKLRLPGFKFEAGDYVFLNIRSVHPLDWHPYTICSDPSDPENLVFLVLYNGQNENSFSGQVVQWARTVVPKLMQSPHQQDGINSTEGEVHVDGPYGRLSVRDIHHEYTHIVLCAGGVGMTPMSSILAELRTLFKTTPQMLKQVQQVHLIWVNSSSDPLNQWFPELLLDLIHIGSPFFLHLFDDTEVSAPQHLSLNHSDAFEDGHLLDGHDWRMTHELEFKPSFQNDAYHPVEVGAVEHHEDIDNKLKSNPLFSIQDPHGSLPPRIELTAIPPVDVAAQAAVSSSPNSSMPKALQLEGTTATTPKSALVSSHTPKSAKAKTPTTPASNVVISIANGEEHLLAVKGRPNYAEFFAELQASIAADATARVAVLACGPEPMMDTVRHEAAEQQFDFHAETFLF